ncbi:hypothetical protein D3C72_2334480 [compost metagenome]
MQLRAAQRDGLVDRQHSALKSRQNVQVEPGPEDRALSRISPLQAKHADFQFVDRDHRHVELVDVYAVGPMQNPFVGLA